MNVAECTVPEKILLAAFELQDQGQDPFSAEALIVVSWQKFPRTFGLKGYADQYPDSNKVLSSIMGEKGLTRRGWLAKRGQKLYSLSRDGRQVVLRILRADEPPRLDPHGNLPRDLDRFFLSLLDSTALEKYLEKRKQELTFAEACRFWNITENMTCDLVESRLQRFHDNLKELERFIGPAGTTLSNGRSVTAEDVTKVRDVDDYLTEKFSRHLSLLRNRAGKT